MLSFLVAFVVAYFIMLSYFTNPGYAMGTHFQESRNAILFQSIVGIIIGAVQWLLLRKQFKIALLWIIIVPVVIIIVDVIIFVILGNLDVHWGEFSNDYHYSYPILLIIEYLLIGSIQSILLAKHFTNTYSWILASSVPWAIILVVSFFGSDPIAALVSLILGLILYSALTGAALMWVVNPKESLI